MPLRVLGLRCGLTGQPFGIVFLIALEMRRVALKCLIKLSGVFGDIVPCPRMRDDVEFTVLDLWPDDVDKLFCRHANLGQLLAAAQLGLNHSRIDHTDLDMLWHFKPEHFADRAVRVLGGRVAAIIGPGT